MELETQIIDAVRQEMPDLDIYHDYAPDNAHLPFMVIQRIGGAGNLYVDEETAGGYQVRFQVSAWHKTRLSAVALSADIEKSLRRLPACCPVGAAESVFDPDPAASGMRQDFYITG